MVRSIHKHKFIPALATVLSITMPFASASATEVSGNPASTTLQVNVAEVLTINLTEPSVWASGDLAASGNTFVSDLLRNKVTLSVISNNPAGYTASMYTKSEVTSLINQTKTASTIPTLSSYSDYSTSTGVLASAFPANYWGYSLNDADTASDSANYFALKTSSDPIQVLQYNDGNSNSRDVFFGAKADITKDSGTYAQTVVFSVVSGVIDDEDNPVVPDNPTGPQNTDTNNPVVAYDNTGGRTVYTNRTTGSGTTTTTSQVSTGDNRSSYSGVTETSYTAPQGVTTSNLSDANILPAVLAGTAAVAAVSGGFILVAAKRKKDDEEES